MKPKRIVVWFSCGAASAVCVDIVVRLWRGRAPIVIAYTAPGEWDGDGRIGEHPDNKRFLKDVEKWAGHKVTVLSSEKYSDPMEVFEARRYIAGVYGAPCTLELKKRVRERFQQPGDLQVFGFTSDKEDAKRAIRFRINNPEVKLWTPLIERSLQKADCLAYLRDAGIMLPFMYKAGYRNNNCIGCVKGQQGYWNKIRKDFPDVFQKTALLEREIGAAINKRYEGKTRIPVYLDELPEGAGNYSAEPDIECGLLCQIAKEEEPCEI